MSYWLFAACFAAIAAGFTAVLSLLRRERQRHYALLDALDRSDRPAAVEQLRAHLVELGEYGVLFGSGFPAETIHRFMAETHLVLAELLLEDDAADDALAELQGARTRHLENDGLLRRSRAYFEAYLLLRRHDEAKRALPRKGYIGRFLVREGDARLCLAQDDAVGALALLGEAFDEEASPLQLVRARALARLARQPDAVERILRAQPRDALEKLIRRNPDEPAASVARRLVAEGGPYR